MLKLFHARRVGEEETQVSAKHLCVGSIPTRASENLWARIWAASSSVERPVQFAGQIYGVNFFESFVHRE